MSGLPTRRALSTHGLFSRRIWRSPRGLSRDRMPGHASARVLRVSRVNPHLQIQDEHGFETRLYVPSMAE